MSSLARIDPFAALEASDSRYVERPGRGGRWLAGRVQRGLCPLLLVGHPGLGKSTELHRAHAELLRDGGHAVLLRLGELRHGSDPDRVLYDVAAHTMQWWVQSGPEEQPSPFLVQDLRASDPHFPQGQGRTLSPMEVSRATFDELREAAGVERLPLLVDGLDALPAEVGRGVIAAFSSLLDQVDLVLAAAPTVAVGAANLQVLDRFRVVVLDPLSPTDPEGETFLRSVVEQHLGVALPDKAAQAIVHASGGVLRDLLGLARDARAYADDEITPEAIRDAVRDRTERYRRLLLAGDRDVLERADGSSGLEVPAERKTRLLHHGLLLESGLGNDAIVRVHPLVRRLLDRD